MLSNVLVQVLKNILWVMIKLCLDLLLWRVLLAALSLATTILVTLSADNMLT